MGRYAMIVTIGEILVEIMAQKIGQDFRSAGLFEGPFASGAPAVFIDQVARLGHRCGIVSAIGRDEFGALNIDRLKADGVDVSAIQIVDSLPTGTAFVRYRHNGERDFVFNLKHSACGVIDLNSQANSLLKQCRHLHIMGSSLFSFRLIDIIKTAADRVKRSGGTVSFSPNVSKELLKITEMRAALLYMLELCDVFLPNVAELTFLTRAKSEDAAIREILSLGVPVIVVRRGTHGAAYHTGTQTVAAPAFQVVPVDKTGAGDCFAATFISCWLRHDDIETCLRYANASGARAMLATGPMEGTSTFEELNAFATSHAETEPL